MESHAIQVQKTARYFTLGSLSEQTETLWFVCHGYGQLANYFLRKFEILADDKTLIIAPEALSRFYLEGNGGKAGASWMTKEARLDEIEDYLSYLNAVFEQVTVGNDPSRFKINVLGFSQGVATASRWVTSGAVRADKLILYAGLLPDDLDQEKAQVLLNNLQLSLVFGTDDELIRKFDFDLDTYLTNFAMQYPHATIHRFAGGHVVLPEVLQALK